MYHPVKISYRKFNLFQYKKEKSLNQTTLSFFTFQHCKCKTIGKCLCSAYRMQARLTHNANFTSSLNFEKFTPTYVMYVNIFLKLEVKLMTVYTSTKSRNNDQFFLNFQTS